MAEAELPPYDKYALPELQGAEKANLPKGFHFYETMIILRPTFTDEER